MGQTKLPFTSYCNHVGKYLSKFDNQNIVLVSLLLIWNKCFRTKKWNVPSSLSRCFYRKCSSRIFLVVFSFITIVGIKFSFIKRYDDLGGQNATVQKVAVCLIKAMQRWVKFVQLPNKSTRAVLWNHSGVFLCQLGRNFTCSPCFYCQLWKGFGSFQILQSCSNFTITNF